MAVANDRLENEVTEQWNTRASERNEAQEQEGERADRASCGITKDWYGQLVVPS